MRDATGSTACSLSLRFTLLDFRGVGLGRGCRGGGTGHVIRRFADLLVKFVLGFLELVHALAQSPGKLWQALGAKEDQDDDEQDDEVT